MDKYEHSTRQYKTTDTSPELHKAQCDIAGVLKATVKSFFQKKSDFFFYTI